MAIIDPLSCPNSRPTSCVDFDATNHWWSFTRLDGQAIPGGGMRPPWNLSGGGRPPGVLNEVSKLFKKMSHAALTHAGNM